MSTDKSVVMVWITGQVLPGKVQWHVRVPWERWGGGGGGGGGGGHDKWILGQFALTFLVSFTIIWNGTQFENNVI